MDSNTHRNTHQTYRRGVIIQSPNHPNQLVILTPPANYQSTGNPSTTYRHTSNARGSHSKQYQQQCSS